MPQPDSEVPFDLDCRHSRLFWRSAGLAQRLAKYRERATNQPLRGVTFDLNSRVVRDEALDVGDRCLAQRLNRLVPHIAFKVNERQMNPRFLGISTHLVDHSNPIFVYSICISIAISRFPSLFLPPGCGAVIMGDHSLFLETICGVCQLDELRISCDVVFFRLRRVYLRGLFN